MKYSKYVSMIILLSLILVACSPAATQQPTKAAAAVVPANTAPALTKAAEGPIVIGTIAPLTGPQQFEGQLEANSVKLAVDQINAAGGLLGRKVTLVIEDDQNQPAVAISAVEKEITEDKIVALQGAQWSGQTKAILPTLAKYGIPAVTAISTAPDITQGNLPGKDWIFRVIPHDGLIAGSVATFLNTNLKATTIAFLVDSGDWGRQSSAVIQTAFEAAGGKVLDLEYYTAGTSNFLTQATKIKGLNPDAVVMVAQGQDGSMMVKQFKEIGFDKPLVGLGSFGSGTFINLAKDAAEGVYGFVQYSNAIDTPANKAFVTAWETAYPTAGVPDKFAWGPYTATEAIFEAIKLANSTNPADIQAALGKVSFQGLTGEIQFDTNHQAHPDVYLTQIQKGIAVTLNSIKTQ